MEDFQILGLDHFYHPNLKVGYSRFFGNAKKKGLFLFNKAFAVYKQKQFHKAFYLLGRSTHYLMDIASPSHTKLIMHFAEDDFEMYVEENIHQFKFKIRSTLIRPMQPEDCFEKLARKSHQIPYIKRNYWIKSIVRIFKKVHQPDPDKTLDKSSRKIIKQTLIYTIALLNAFNRKIIMYNFNQRRKKLVRRIKSIPSKV